MGIHDRLISSLGNMLATLTELVGVVSGDKKCIVKPVAVQRALITRLSNCESQPLASPCTSINNDANDNKVEDKELNDIHLSVPEIIQKYGFPFECHNVRTKDGYILSVFRIPFGRQREDKPRPRPRPPVLLVHGLLNSAGAWIMHDTDKALAYMLADSGYDCWMLNCRGCTHSRSHETLGVEDKEFWDFSFHEQGVFDVPPVIEHILQITGFPSLYYIGHSLGNTKLMIAMNEDDTLSSKIKLLICLAPAVYLYKTTARILSLNAPFYRQQKAFLDFFTTGELMSKTFLQQVKMFGRLIPNPEQMAAKCVTMSMYTMGGYNPDQLYLDKLPIVAAHTPSSSSVRTYIHCLQYLVNPEFQQYDHGPEGNIIAYGQASPPKYDLNRVTCPTVIFYGENDLLCRPETVLQLSQELPNVIGCYRVDSDLFSHTDFLYAKDADVLVYDKVVDILNKSYES